MIIQNEQRKNKMWTIAISVVGISAIGFLVYKKAGPNSMNNLISGLLKGRAF